MEFEKCVKIRQEKFGAVVFDTLREKVFVTNETGAGILRCLKEKKEPKEVAVELAKDYDCGQGVIERDVEEFILGLKENGLFKKEEE